jgi:YVTN family beta-propeller protein
METSTGRNLHRIIRRIGCLAPLLCAAAIPALTGCGNVYRPVVTPITITGPASQPNELVAVLSSPGPAANGVVTILDFSGDSIDATIQVGINPIGLTLDGSGTNGYTINADSTLSIFAVSSTVQTKSVTTTTLPTTTQAANLLAAGSNLYLADSGTNSIDVLQSTPPSLRQAIPVGLGPIATVGNANAQRAFAVSQLVDPGVCDTPSSVTTPGEVSVIENSSITVSNIVPAGICPVYAIMSADSQRVFVLNRGSGTVTVLNAQGGVLDTNKVSFGGAGFNGTLCLSNPNSSGVCSPSAGPAGPVQGEYLPASDELIVANYDAGTISVIDVSIDVFGNDSPTFGHTVTIPVGTHPAAVTVLQNGTKAYVANQGDGTVSVVNLSSNTVERVIPVTGHPRAIYSVTNSLYSKAYVASPDTSTVTVIRSDTDIVSALISVQGNVVDVHPAGQAAGTNGNPINFSRTSGSGQP